jgi:uncharacterized membrane protein YphA (DoxX/SURF4 family)
MPQSRLRPCLPENKTLLLLTGAKMEARGSSMVNRRALSNLGIYVYGVAAIALGVIGLVWRDFATNWQRVQENVPHREALAYIAAVCELFGGVAILWRRTALAGAMILATLYSIFALLWVPRIFGSPQVYDVWANFFEEFSLVIAGVVISVSLAPPDSVRAGRTARISRSYGICVISFALEHLFYISGTASFVPKWIPPGQLFWAIATAVFFLLAAIAILSGILASLASRLLTAMIVGFEALVWAPKLFASPHVHFSWSGNAICLALAGAAWVVADLISGSQKASPKPLNSATSL